MKPSRIFSTLPALAACLTLGACATQITEGPTRPQGGPVAAPAPTPRPPTTTSPTTLPTTPAATPQPKPTPAARPTPYPIQQKPNTGSSPLAPRPDQPLWQRTE